MRRNEPIAITGLAVVCALGNDTDSVWRAVINGECGLREIETLDVTGLYFRYGGELRNFEASSRMNQRMYRHMDRGSKMGIHVTDAALRQAGVAPSGFDPYRIGISLGTSLGGLAQGEAFHRDFLEKGYRRTHRRHLANYPLHTPADQISTCFGIRGPKFIVSNACAAGANAIGLAIDVLQAGRADIMVAGGVDPLDILSLAGFNSLQAVDAQPCSPYSRSEGINVAEGAAMLILEPESLARQRGAKILAYVLGYGLSSDAYHATSPDPAGSGAVRSMTRALQRAGLDSGDVDYVNGHGTGTLANDSAETKAFRTLFGGRAKEVPVSSTKSQIGHCLGAAGAVEAVVCVNALQKQILPPTVNFTESPLTADLDFVPGRGRPGKVEVAVSNSFAFGGNNCSLVLGRDSVPLPTGRECEVVITGVGIVSPLGTGRDELLGALKAGTTAVGPIRSFDASGCRSQVAGEMSDTAFLRYIDPAYARRLDQLGCLAMASARMAFKDADYRVQPAAADRIGVIFGTGTGPLETVEAVSRTIIQQGAGKVNPRLFPNTVMNAAAGHLCLALQIKGPTATLATGSAAGLSAVAYAADMIRRGEADAMLAVSADELTPMLHIGYDRMGVVTRERVQPYDRNRSGTALASGSVAILLESKSHALARGAAILGTVLGWSCTSDAYKVAGNDPGGDAWAQCFRISLSDAGLAADQIACLYGDARGVRDVDLGEARAMASVFGGTNVRLANLTGQAGYAQGTAAPLSLVAALETLRSGWVPEVFGLEKPLPEIEEFWRRGSVADGRACMVTSASWGGTYVSVVVGNAEG